MSEYKFPTTLPIDITFFNAESVSPVKLNNIFSYIKAALYSMEMYMGNGIDFGATDNSDRMAIANLSSAIGTVIGNIYIPYNLLGTTLSVYKNYASTYGNTGIPGDNTSEHSGYNQVEASLRIKDTVNIPVNRTFDYGCYVGLHYNANGTNVDSNIGMRIICLDSSSDTGPIYYPLDGTPAEVLNSPNVLMYYCSSIPAETFISHIELTNTDPTNVIFKVFSLFITEPMFDKQYINTAWKSVDGNTLSMPYNNFYGIGLDHLSDNGTKSYCRTRPPCKWCSPDFNTGNVTCDRMIGQGICAGNTYDIYVDNGDLIENKRGIAVCGGSVVRVPGSAVNSALVPPNDLYYQVDYDGTTTPNYLLMQSPLVIYKTKKSLRFHPISFTTIGEAVQLEKGRLHIYDTNPAGKMPVNYLADYISTSRPDIVKVTGNVASDDGYKYIVLSSEAGISDMEAASEYIDAVTPKRSISVYAD